MSSNSQLPFPPVRRIVTGHNDKAIAVIKEDAPKQPYQTDHGPYITTLWATNELPPDVSSPEDKGLVNPPLNPDGTIFRVLDLPPHTKGKLHRTISLDCIYIIHGKVVFTLDDGSRTPMKANDVVIQQAIMHGWENETDEWARLLCILVRSEPPVVNGKKLEAEQPFKV